MEGLRRCARSLIIYSFNGATALRPWKGRWRDLSDVPMGKLQWGHGLAAVEGESAAPAPDHIPLLQWGHGLAAVEGWERANKEWCARNGFNGATALRPWKGTAAGRPGALERMLQWGHGLAAVEGFLVVGYELALRVLQWGHGLAAVEGATAMAIIIDTPSFNGATALRPWKV